MARPTKQSAVAIWHRFAFIPNPAGYEIVRFTGESTGDDLVIESSRTLVDVLRNLTALAADRWSAQEIEDVDDRLASFDEVREWMDLTRSVSARFPYGGRYADDMRELADRVERVQLTSAKFSDPAPRGRIEEGNYRFNMLLWGINELRKAARIPASETWDVLRNWFTYLPPDQQPQFDDDALQRRIDRFSANLKPGVASLAMFEILQDATEHGPFMPDGSPRPGLKLRQSVIPRSAN